MRCWMASPALVIALLAVPLLAQRHGASGGFSGHSGPSGGSFMGHGSMSNHGSSFSGNTHFGSAYGSSRRPTFFPYPRRSSRFNRPRFFSGVSPWLSYGYPGYYAYPYYGNYDDASTGYHSSDNYAGSYDNQSGEMDQGKIDRLENEVAQLREERNSLRPQAKAEIRASTVLVFRDQHTQDVQNYAIVADTLWVFDPQKKASKIQVDDLDVPATTKANDDRGVDFRLPDQQ